MKFIIACFLLLLTSCQNPSLKSDYSRRNSSNEEYYAQIKLDKKRQAEADLPFRGFSYDKSLQTIAFGFCSSAEQTSEIWSAIEKNNPGLMIVFSEKPKTLVTLPEYRSVREKIPFMATWGSSEDVDRGDFLKNWPYVRNIIPEKQDGIYHSRMFGTKKNQVQVIMLDIKTGAKSLLPETQWTWLENELKKPAAFRIIASSLPVVDKWADFPTDRERFFNLIKKGKSRNTLILSPDRAQTVITKTEIKNHGVIYQATSSGLNRGQSRDIANSDEKITVANFGLVKFDWEKRLVQVELKSPDNSSIQSETLPF